MRYTLIAVVAYLLIPALTAYALGCAAFAIAGML